MAIASNVVFLETIETITLGEALEADFANETFLLLQRCQNLGSRI